MATGKSDLLDEALIFAGATTSKLTNTSAFIFFLPPWEQVVYYYCKLIPAGARGLFIIVSSHSQKFFKMDIF